MRKDLKNLSAAAFTACVLLSSCNKDSVTELTTDFEQTPINLSMDIWSTRITDQGYELNDKVGIYVVNNNTDGTSGEFTSTGNHVDNVRFTKGSDKWISVSDIYWVDKVTKADVYCYFPQTDSIADIHAHTMSIKTDQSNIHDYKASEFLWGKAADVVPTTSTVTVVSYRTVCNVLIYLTPGKGFTNETFAQAEKSVRIKNMKTNGTIDLATGKVTATGDIADVVPYQADDHYRALLIPQTIADGTEMIVVTVDGKEYIFSRGFTFGENRQYRFTVTVNKIGSGMDIGVGGWQQDDTDNGGDAE